MYRHIRFEPISVALTLKQYKQKQYVSHILWQTKRLLAKNRNKVMHSTKQNLQSTIPDQFRKFYGLITNRVSNEGQ